MTLGSRGVLVVPGFINFHWNPTFTVTAFFQRTMWGTFQSLVGNGFGSLSSWELRLPASNGATDDIGVYLSMEVRQGRVQWRDCTTELTMMDGVWLAVLFGG